ncbi:MAG: glycosyltransferase [Candidatus Eisenbacteria bacterium]
MPERSSKEPIPVAFVTDLLSVGGAEAQLVALTRALDPSRIRCAVAVLRAENAAVERLTVPTTVIGMRHGCDARVLPSLAAWMRRGRFRAIYTTHLWSIVFSALLKGWMRPPAPQGRLVLLATEHSYRVPTASRRVLVTARRWALRRADRIIAVAETQAEWLREYYGERTAPIEVIPNGLDCGPFENLPSGTAVRAEFGIPGAVPLILCIARMVPVKNLDVLLAAMALSPLRETGAHLLLLGDGPVKGALMERARGEALEGRVHFAGTRQDTRPFLAAADLACLPSRSEAQPIAILEAMAAGLPVVATRVGGIPEMVEDGKTGLLVAPGNPAELADALARALADPSWARLAGEGGRSRVEAVFSIQARARRIEGLIERLVERA